MGKVGGLDGEGNLKVIVIEKGLNKGRALFLLILFGHRTMITPYPKRIITVIYFFISKVLL